MAKLKDVNVELTLLVECESDEYEKLESIIDEGGVNGNEYSLTIIGSTEYEDNTKAIYILMNTDGSYEINLKRLSKLHLKITELLNDTSVKYKGISLIPNTVKWEQ
ncbi:TPA: hypothetical protein KQF34_003065 [Clostridioides difficile]|nr:hypothetical protein [Clostridioides difficile]